VTSVLELLRLYLPTFTFASVVQELQCWWVDGCSCFEKLLKKGKLKQSPAATSILDRLFPQPSATG
jgi:hypothetical protein